MKILTFDIEDWFHILDNQSTKTEIEWFRFMPRIYENVDRILNGLEKRKVHATFFCLGWIAQKYPDIIKKIHKHGHEIGSHSYMHQLVYEQTPEEFRNDLIQSIQRIEDITGEKVLYYRSPGFSLTSDCLWVFEILHECGIEVDCSIYPAPRSHGGISDFPISTPFLIKGADFEIKEFPMSVWGIRMAKFAFAGGGYFRFLPYSLIKRIATKRDYVMTYFHPRDFDKNQPVIKDLSPFRKFKSYYGLNGSYSKFENLISDFNFISIKEAVHQVDWTKVPSITIS